MGDPGLFKSTLTLDIAARVTTGRAWPDGCGVAPVGNVVILTAEDGLADTVRPRLDCFGADIGRVSALTAVRDRAGEHSFCLLRDIEALRCAVVEKQAVLVILDPLDAYLAGVDSHKAAEVRTALAPIAMMAEDTGVAVVVVTHLNKSAATQNALYRATGSLDFVAAARSVIGVALDPDSTGRYLLLPVKLNVASMPEGLGYSRPEDAPILWDCLPVTIDASEAFGMKKRADSTRWPTPRSSCASRWRAACRDRNKTLWMRRSRKA